MKYLRTSQYTKKNYLHFKFITSLTMKIQLL